VRIRSVGDFADGKKVFPRSLSSRQFRVAFHNLIRVTSPPSRTAATQPLLATTLLEMVHERALHAPTTPLSDTHTVTSIEPPLSRQGPEQTIVPQLSEQAVLVSSLIDVLPSLSLALLEEWLPLVARLVNHIRDPAMRDHCNKSFCDMLVSGDMDPERSQVCVAWWMRGGGKAMLSQPQQETHGEVEDPYVMSPVLSGVKAMTKL